MSVAVGVSLSWRQVTHGWATPARMRKQCCYGQKNLGQYVAVCPRLQLTFNIQPISTLSRIKCERYIFIKKCVRSFIEVVIIVDYVSAYIMYMYMNYEYTTKAAYNKRVAIWSFVSHLENHLSKTSNMCWALLEMYRWTQKRCFLMDSYTWTHLCWPTSKTFHQLCAETGCRVESFPREMADIKG